MDKKEPKKLVRGAFGSVLPFLNVRPLLLPTYLNFIQNMVGSSAFRHSFAVVNGKKKDMLEDGRVSCAFFASSVMRVFGLANDIHATVPGTLRDMEQAGWQKISKPKPGAILVWASKSDENDAVIHHTHIGFYAGDKKAVSNNPKGDKAKDRVIIKHHWTFGVNGGKPKRKVEAIYWHPKLDS